MYIRMEISPCFNIGELSEQAIRLKKVLMKGDERLRIDVVFNYNGVEMTTLSPTVSEMVVYYHSQFERNQKNRQNPIPTTKSTNF